MTKIFRYDESAESHKRHSKMNRLIDRLRQIDQERMEITEELKDMGSLDFIIDERAVIPSAYIWRCLQRPEIGSLSLEKVFEDFSTTPEYSLAALLESELKTLRHASQLTINQVEDSKLSFCISGQVFLADLRKMSEHHIDCLRGENENK